jgi:hypothetical protein
VALNSGVPLPVQDASVKIVTPLDSQTPGSQVFVPISSNAGETIVIAADANNNIMLASLSTSTSVMLGVDSTALALTRIALGAAACLCIGKSSERGNPRYC